MWFSIYIYMNGAIRFPRLYCIVMQYALSDNIAVRLSVDFLWSHLITYIRFFFCLISFFSQQHKWKFIFLFSKCQWQGRKIVLCVLVNDMYFIYTLYKGNVSISRLCERTQCCCVYVNSTLLAFSYGTYVYNFGFLSLSWAGGIFILFAAVFLYAIEVFQFPFTHSLGQVEETFSAVVLCTASTILWKKNA